jgi:dienelactone hydrolase
MTPQVSRRVRQYGRVFGLILLMAVPLACQQGPSYTVSFLDRTIDLEPYVQGFPYRDWFADFDAGRLFYDHQTEEGTFLMVQSLDQPGVVDPEAGSRLTEIDWSTRNMWGMEFDSISGDMIILGDERNDEVLNLFRLSLTDGTVTKLTDVPYIYGYGFSKDKGTIGYIARHGSTEPYRNCLVTFDVRTAEQQEILCEEGGEHRMVWSAVNWRPDGSGIVLMLNRLGDRNQGTLAYLDLSGADPSLEILLPDGTQRSNLFSYEDAWLDNDRFFYSSDETGYANMYVYDLARRVSRQVTSIDEQAWFTPLDVDGSRLVLVNYDRPHENELAVIDPETGAELGRKHFDTSLGIIGFDDRNRMFLSQTSAASPFRADELAVIASGDEIEWQMTPKILLPEQHVQAVVQCDVERLEYPTFDLDPATGQTRMLHAFLMTPKRPRASAAEQLAVITAFYGGGNNFSTRHQIYCEAGISWLSPAVRGSSGFGREFEALNDRDLGGDEIIDLFYGARFLEEKLGLAPSQIGVAGGSWGGYATMRALTYPPETNERNESYDLGFGMSHAGFSSIVSFYDATNIPDWIMLEAGDPSTESDKLLDRSPLMHVDLLDSPLLLTHGSNDNRVGVTESRQFHETARELGKPISYVEFEGQGHGIRGLINLLRYYQTQFDFLQSVVCEREGDGTPASCGVVQ